MPQNKVTLHPDDNDIIVINVVGDQTPDSIQAMGEEAIALVAQQRTNGKPVLVLDDLRKMGAVPAEGLQLVVELAKTVEYEKLAMVGSGGILRLGANLMLRATGKSDKVRYFDNYDAAIAWLRAGYTHE